MDHSLTLRQHLEHQARRDPRGPAIAAAVEAMAQAAVEISTLASRAPLAGLIGAARGRNADGDVQKDMDVRADEIVRQALRFVPLSAIASEEAETAEMGDPSAAVAIAFDPLDGSSNIDTNMSIGTIFSIVPTPPGGADAFAGEGNGQLAAGFFVYGPQTCLVLTVGDGVDIFLLDRRDDRFKAIRQRVRIPAATVEYAINASNHRHWERPVRAYVDDCLAGRDGPRGKDFNLRWIGSLVAEAYRILTRGGVFLYPSDGRRGYKDGRLRLVYEAHPMAFVMEQAGGGASTGRAPILSLGAASLHQRVPLIMGSSEEVARIERLHTNPHIHAETDAPLFARRGLFRV